MDDDVKMFVEELGRLGGRSGNYKLKRDLGWDDARYWLVHGRVADAGLVSRGVGRGGTVSIRLPESVAGNSADPTIDAAAAGQYVARVYAKELELYDPAKQVIEKGWSRERSYDDLVVEITASPGRVQTGGTWTRPDVTLLGTKTYPYLPGRFFEIVTFEVKTVDAVDVRGVFEALSHAQFATLSYVLFFTDGKEFREFQNSERVIELAAKHGVGVIAAAKIEDFEYWDELVQPDRNIFDPAQANTFIGTSFSKTAQERVVKWSK